MLGCNHSSSPQEFKWKAEYLRTAVSHTDKAIYLSVDDIRIRLFVRVWLYTCLMHVYVYISISLCKTEDIYKYTGMIHDNMIIYATITKHIGIRGRYTHRYNIYHTHVIK